MINNEYAFLLIVNNIAYFMLFSTYKIEVLFIDIFYTTLATARSRVVRTVTSCTRVIRTIKVIDREVIDQNLLIVVMVSFSIL